MKEIKKIPNMFLVLKREDLQNYLSIGEFTTLCNILDAVNDGRKKEGKEQNDYIVCNQDEPYAEKIWQIILDGERAKQVKEVEK